MAADIAKQQIWLDNIWFNTGKSNFEFVNWQFVGKRSYILDDTTKRSDDDTWLSRFWKLEEYPVDKWVTISLEEQKCEDYFVNKKNFVN